MHMNETKQAIFGAAKRLFAEFGYSGLSMRQLAQEAGISLSVTYHYYHDKDELLRQIFEHTSRQLGVLRKDLPQRTSMREMLRDRVAFQIDNCQDIVFILKYYMHYRNRYAHHSTGYLPVKAYQHIEEVLQLGRDTHEIELTQPIEKEAKVITHAINGFLLEYFPTPPSGTEREELIMSITDFVCRALQGGAVAVEPTT